MKLPELNPKNVGIGIAGALLVPVVLPMAAAVLKPIIKGVIKGTLMGGYYLVHQTKLFVAETKETVEDLSAEVRSEVSQLAEEARSEVLAQSGKKYLNLKEKN